MKRTISICFCCKCKFCSQAVGSQQQLHLSTSESCAGHQNMKLPTVKPHMCGTGCSMCNVIYATDKRTVLACYI